MTDLKVLTECAATFEALIFASAKPVRERELKYHLPENISVAEVMAAVLKRYDKSSGIELCKVGDSWAFRTRTMVAKHLEQHKIVTKSLSRAAMEVLAIIAYHQPITRAEIEEIRGISLSKGTMDIFLELTWIKPLGRRRTPGQPLTWGTSSSFLDYFGLSDIADLPGLEDLKASGLLRKGQILGALMDQNEDEDIDDADEDVVNFDDDFLEEPLLGNSYNGDSDA